MALGRTRDAVARYPGWSVSSREAELHRQLNHGWRDRMVPVAVVAYVVALLNIFIAAVGASEGRWPLAILNLVVAVLLLRQQWIKS